MSNGNGRIRPDLILEQTEPFACSCGGVEFEPRQMVFLRVDRLNRRQYHVMPGTKMRCFQCGAHVTFRADGGLEGTEQKGYGVDAGSWRGLDVPGKPLPPEGLQDGPPEAPVGG